MFVVSTGVGWQIMNIYDGKCSGDGSVSPYLYYSNFTVRYFISNRTTREFSPLDKDWPSFFLANHIDSLPWWSVSYVHWMSSALVRSRRSVVPLSLSWDVGVSRLKDGYYNYSFLWLWKGSRRCFLTSGKPLSPVWNLDFLTLHLRYSTFFSPPPFTPIFLFRIGTIPCFLINFWGINCVCVKRRY